jgi:hypothetical protein
MDNFTCNICNYTTKLRANYNRHLETNKHNRNVLKDNGCSVNNIDIKVINETQKTQKDPQKTQKDPQKTQKDPQKTRNETQMSKNNLKEIKCNYCDNNFSSYAHKRRHELHRCKEAPVEDTLYKSEKKEWRKEKKILYKQIEALIKKAGNITNNTLNLNSYGKEDLSHITNSFKNQMIKGPFGMIPKMIEAIHFNKEKPENKNISYPNKKHNSVKIFKEGEWKYYNKGELMDEMIENNYYILDVHYDERGDNLLNDVQKKRYRKFKDKYDNGELDKGIKDDINIILLNN